MANGDFLARIKLALEGKDQVVAGLQQTQQAAQQLSRTKVTTTFDKEGLATGKKIEETFGNINATAKKSTPITDQLGMAMRRALIVAPIWMAAREVLKEMITFVKEGIQYFFDVEKATHNLTSSLNTMGESGKMAVQGIVDNMHQLSIETGKSEASLINIFANTNRILQDTTKSQIATTEATKLSLETGADAAKIAETMAMLYRLQGDTLKGVTTDTQKFQEISALLYATQAKTPGGIEKLEGDIKQFQATMNVTDFGLANTIKLFGALESAGVSNSMAMRTGLLRVLTNLDETSKMLGIDFPKNASSAEVFVAVLNKLGTALKNPSQQGNIYNVIKDIFGGAIRGGTNLGSLAKDVIGVQEALSGKGVSERDRYLQAKQLEDINNEASHQADIFANLKKQVGETFVTAVLGGKDFAQAIKILTSDLKALEPILHGVGLSIRTVFTGQLPGGGAWNILGILNKVSDKWDKIIMKLSQQEDLGKRIQLGLKGEATLSELTEMLAEAKKSGLLKQAGIQDRIVTELQNQINKENTIKNLKEEQNKKSEISIILAKKQADEMQDLILQLAKATPEEKPALRRKIELSQMSPDMQVMASMQSKTDRELLLSMISKLPEEVRSAMTGQIAMEQGIYTGGRFSPFLPYNKEPLAKTGQQLISINPKAADTINVNIAMEAGRTFEETVDKANKEIMRTLLSNEDFRKAFGKGMGKNITP